MKNVLVAAVAALSLVATAAYACQGEGNAQAANAPACDGAHGEAAQAAAPAMSSTPAPGMKQVAFNIDHMACAKCQGKITAALKKLEGVKNAQVSLEKKGATVEYDPAKTSPDAMLKAITAAGFKAKIAG